MRYLRVGGLAAALLLVTATFAVDPATTAATTPVLSAPSKRPAARTPNCTWPVNIRTVSSDLRLHASKALLVAGSKTPPVSYGCDYDAYANHSLKGFAQLEYILPSKADLSDAVPVFLAVYHGKKVSVGQAAGYAVIGAEMTFVMVAKGWELMMVMLPVPKLAGAEQLARTIASRL